MNQDREREVVREIGEKVAKTTISVTRHNYWDKNEDDTPVMVNTEVEDGILYFNAVREGYCSVYYPVEDICDISADFVMIEDLYAIVEDTANYYVERCCRSNHMTVWDRGQIESEIKIAIERGKKTNSRRKWVNFLDVFPQFVDGSWRDWNGTMDAITQNDNCPFEITYRREKDQRDAYPRFALKEDIVKARKERIPPKPIIYKLGMTRTGLRNYWNDLVNMMNRYVEINNIPMNIVQRDNHNIHLVIKCMKNLGVTMDDLVEHTYWLREIETNEHNDEARKKRLRNQLRIYKALYRSPKKYRIIPKKIEDAQKAEAEKAKEKVDTSK